MFVTKLSQLNRSGQNGGVIMHTTSVSLASVPGDSTNWFSDLLDNKGVEGPFVVLAVLLAGLVVSRLSHFVIRRVIRRVASRTIVGALGNAGLWRVRLRRVGDETGAVRDERRRQRIDAASRMVNHIASLVVWIIATIVTFKLLDVDPAFFLSSAGFIGAAIAIGGQHKVNDYLTGLSVHFEDRYGIGDEIVAEIGWDQPIQAIVDHIGLFSTRLRDARGTLHFPNSTLADVRNLSQEAVISTIRLHVPNYSDADAAASTLRGLAGTDGLTDVVFIGDLTTSEPSTGEVDVEVRTTKTLNDKSRARLVRRTERALFDGKRD